MSTTPDDTPRRQPPFTYDDAIYVADADDLAGDAIPWLDVYEYQRLTGHIPST